MKNILKLFWLVMAFSYSYAGGFIPSLVKDKTVIEHFDKILPNLINIYTTPMQDIYAFKVNNSVVYGSLYSNYLFLGEMNSLNDASFSISKQILLGNNYKFNANVFTVLPEFKLHNTNNEVKNYFFKLYNPKLLSNVYDSPFRNICTLHFGSEKATLYQDVKNKEYYLGGTFDSKLIQQVLSKS